MSRRVLSLASVAIGCAALLQTGDAHAFCRMTTDGGAQIGNASCVERGEPLEWADPCLSYAVDSRGSSWMSQEDINAAIDASFATWMGADCDGSPPNVIFKPLPPSTCRRAEFNTGPNVNTIAFLDPWRDPCLDANEPGYDSNAFAVTIVWHNTNTGEILDADMMINDTEASATSAGGPYDNCPPTGCDPGSRLAPGPADLASIVTHEAGHFIGIGHSDLPEATMFASAERSSVEKRDLAQDDIDAICTIYPPGNLDLSCNETPINGLQLNCETDSQGNVILCDEPGATSSGGCSAGSTSGPADVPWGIALAVLLGLTVLRRRSRRFDARF